MGARCASHLSGVRPDGCWLLTEAPACTCLHAECSAFPVPRPSSLSGCPDTPAGTAQQKAATPTYPVRWLAKCTCTLPGAPAPEMPSHQTGRPLWKVRCASRAIAAVDCLHALHHLTMHLSSQCLLSLKQPLSPALSTAGGQSWSSSAAGLVVRVRSISNDTGSAAAAVVSVCRRAGPETVASCLAGSDNDCNGLAGRDDPSRSRLLPPAPVAVGAVPRKHVRRVPPTQRWAARGSSRRLGRGRK